MVFINIPNFSSLSVPHGSIKHPITNLLISIFFFNILPKLVLVFNNIINNFIHVVENKILPYDIKSNI